ncbi:MAG: circadian clock protein KaiC [Halobacteriales archaeon]|jgi:circadian clock protein KaiC
MSTNDQSERCSVGIPGLDAVLQGGVRTGRSFMVRGPPGAGKTLMGLHFLTAGEPKGEDRLFVNFGEPAEYVRKDAEAFGFDMDGVDILDLGPSQEFFTEQQSYSLFEADEVESESVLSEISAAVEERDLDRVFVDPLTQLRYLSTDNYQFRKQVLSFLRLLKHNGVTVLFTSQATAADPDDDLQFMSDGVINLTAETPRTLRVTKFRGSDFDSGAHTLRISDEGMAVAPILRPDEYSRPTDPTDLSSGIPELDQLLKGGLTRGTVSIVTGPTGAGKTTVGTQFMKEASGRGERSVIYSFEESRETLLHRSKAINIPVSEMIDRGTLSVEVVPPDEYSPDEFAQLVMDEVDDEDAKLVMIDGVDGYEAALQGDPVDPQDALGRLGRYLRNMGVTTLITNEVPRITGDFQATGRGLSQFADTILFLRHLEYGGEIHKSIGVLKNRTSDFERTLRRLEITEHGIKVGEPLTGLRGILTGTPEWTEGPPEDE